MSIHDAALTLALALLLASCAARFEGRTWGSPPLSGDEQGLGREALIELLRTRAAIAIAAGQYEEAAECMRRVAVLEGRGERP